MGAFTFTDLSPAEKPGSFDVLRKGTHFGPRISGDTVLALYAEHGPYLPFDIMAAFYGDDDDWVGLMAEDIEGFEGEGAALEDEWGPFEVFPDEPQDTTTPRLRRVFVNGGPYVATDHYQFTWTMKLRNIIDGMLAGEPTDIDLEVAEVLREAMWFGIRNGAD